MGLYLTCNRRRALFSSDRWLSVGLACTRKGGRQVEREYDRVPILCEGEQTEVSYFSELLACYRISKANGKVVHGGSQPKTLVQWAKKLRKDKERL